MTSKDIVPESIARLLYKKGFDESCLFWYSSTHSLVRLSTMDLPRTNSTFKESEKYYKEGCYPVSAPTFQEATRWFRETHNIDLCVCRELDEYGKCLNGYIAVVYQDGFYKVTIRSAEEDLTYEEASNKAIKYGLTLI